ncbi:hypothetical protein ACFSJU_14495 [Paradesertivirga mongoliensis]|uniref:Uncharacterized protein n=1 Tax=Paradesertivirga mongoliensis TaxID=2100740 RepID=A0ABW4ZP37_9SPHI|nr:hypothetical protein [Pedobacter mongoliensis]
MQQPFDIELGGVIYSVFPEEEDVYTIFKEGEEYIKIQKDTDQHWLKLDDETDLPLFTEDQEVDNIGRAISEYKEEETDEDQISE